MIINLKTYADLRRCIGTETLNVDMDEGASVQDVFYLLIKKHGPKIHNLIQGDRVAVLVNGHNISVLKGFETNLKHGDKITILPVVSGG